jgi:hypothetical protein
MGPSGNAFTRSFKKLLGRDDDSRSASAMNAQKFAEALRGLRDANQRSLSLDTYVLHTSYYSLVTVGSFDSDSDPRLRYLQAMIPRMQIIGSLGGQQAQLNQPFAGGPSSVLAQPMPMPVPR